MINGGNSNCITYDGFGGDAPSSAATDNDDDDDGDGDIAYMSAYCKKKEYYGALTPALWGALLDFSQATNASFVWHLNMAFGRGYAPRYVPWNAAEAQGLLNRSAADLAGVMLFEEVKKSKVGFDVTPADVAEDFTRLTAALALAEHNGTPSSSAEKSGTSGKARPLVFGVLD